MPKETITLEFTRKELTEILAKVHNLNPGTAKLNLRVTQGSSRESGSTHISISGERKKDYEPRN